MYLSNSFPLPLSIHPAVILLNHGSSSGADPGFVERGGTAATASAAGAKVFGGSCLKTLFGISGARPPLNPLVVFMTGSVDSTVFRVS